MVEQGFINRFCRRRQGDESFNLTRRVVRPDARRRNSRAGRTWYSIQFAISAKPHGWLKKGAIDSRRQAGERASGLRDKASRSAITLSAPQSCPEFFRHEISLNATDIGGHLARSELWMILHTSSNAAVIATSSA